MDAMSPVRFRLQELIDERDTSQSELARQSGVAFSTISKMCRNVSVQVSLATLDALSRVLGVEPGDLIERTPAKRPGKNQQ
jgi:DNA-binding Xre family transcriptional regulator